MTTFSQKILKEPFILEAIKSSSIRQARVYSAFMCPFCATLSCASYRLFCIKIVVTNSVLKYWLPLSYFLSQIRLGSVP